MTNEITPVKVLVDTGAWLPEELLRRYNIDQIPLSTVIGEAVRSDFEIRSSDVVKALEEGKVVTTSAPVPEEIEMILERTIAEGYRDIIVVTLPEHSSATFENVQKAAARILTHHAEEEPGGRTKPQRPEGEIRIEIIDSQGVSMTEGLLALRISELLKQGASFEQAVDFARAHRWTLMLLVALEDPKYAARGGRLDKGEAFKARLGSWLNLHPATVILPGERAEPFRTNIRKMSDALELIATKAAEYRAADGRLAVAHVGSEKNAQKVAQLLSEKTGIPFEDIIRTDASSAVAAHAGPGAVGIAVECGRFLVRVKLSG